MLAPIEARWVGTTTSFASSSTGSTNNRRQRHMPELTARTRNCPTPKLFTCQISELRSFIGGKRRAPIVAGRSKLPLQQQRQRQPEQIYLFKREPSCGAPNFKWCWLNPDMHSEKLKENCFKKNVYFILGKYFF